MTDKVLIAYFSHWGHSQKFAQQIQKITQGDLFEIKTSTIYPVPHDPCSIQAHKEQLADFRPKLITHVQNIDKYDTVLIGHPIWWYREPMAIRSFWEEYDFSGKKIIPFCTSGDVGIENTGKDTKQFLPSSEIKKGLRLETHEVDNNVLEIKSWLEDVGVLI